MSEQPIHMQPYMDGIVKPTVADVARRFADYVEAEDLMQEAALWWYGPGQQYLLEYLTADDNFVRLRRSIWRFVARYAQKEKAQKTGYEPEDQVVYRPDEIAALLPVAMDPEGLPAHGFPDESGIRTHNNKAEGGDVLAALVDVRRALSRLAEPDRHFLQLVEDLAQEWERIAAHTETQPDSARRRHARIIQRMARWLSTTDEDKEAA